MMICPDKEDISPSMLLSLVKEANHMVVTMGEVLSDNIYYYDRELQRLTFIPQTEYNSKIFLSQFLHFHPILV